MMLNMGFTETAVLRWHVALAHQPSGSKIPLSIDRPNRIVRPYHLIAVRITPDV